MKASAPFAAHVFVLVVTFAATDANAVLTGTVTGCVNYDDLRVEGSANSGSLRDSNAGTTPMKRVLVQLLGGGGGLVAGSTHTDFTTGCYSISYVDPTAYSFPTSGWKLRVRLQNTDDYEIKTPSGGAFVYDANVTLHDNNESLGNATPQGDDEIRFSPRSRRHGTSLSTTHRS